jgi:hypothetical protein
VLRGNVLPQLPTRTLAVMRKTKSRTPYDRSVLFVIMALWHPSKKKANLSESFCIILMYSNFVYYLRLHLCHPLHDFHCQRTILLSVVSFGWSTKHCDPRPLFILHEVQQLSSAQDTPAVFPCIAGGSRRNSVITFTAVTTSAYTN